MNRLRPPWLLSRHITHVNKTTISKRFSPSSKNCNIGRQITVTDDFHAQTPNTPRHHRAQALGPHGRCARAYSLQEVAILLVRLLMPSPRLQLPRKPTSPCPGLLTQWHRSTEGLRKAFRASKLTPGAWVLLDGCQGGTLSIVEQLSAEVALSA